MNPEFEEIQPLIDRRATKMLIKISVLTQFIFAVVSVNNLFVGDYLLFSLTFGIVLFLFSIRWLVSIGHYKLGVHVLIYSITTMLAYFAWQGYGIFDQAIFGFSTVIIYSSIIGSKRLLISLMSYMSILCIIIAITYQGSDTLNFSTEQIYRATSDVLIVLASIGAASWYLHSDQLFIIDALKNSNKQVILTQKEIKFNSSHDKLTGLPNRAGIYDQFDEISKRCHKTQHDLCLIFIDLDKLKSINDTMGHVAGDEFLNIIADRIRELNNSENICRYGADDFIIFVEDDLEAAKKMAQNIINEISVPILINSNSIRCTCSAGISVLNKENDIDTLIRESDSAMYKAKSLGRNKYQVFDPNYYEQFKITKKMSDSILGAISKKEFELHYQPKIDLHTNKIQGFEALIRWEHPEFGNIPPVTFIPIAEKNGHIVELGQWIIDQACKQAKAWCNNGFKDFSIAINVSIVQFQRGGIDEFFKQTLEHYELESKFIEIEITESLFLDDNESDLIKQEFDNIKINGIQLSIDDFGTGYSNMGYLKKLDVKYLKIDRSFIQNIVSNHQDLIIVKAIISLAKNLEIKTVAEGVESLDISDILKELDCDIVQGYYYSKPCTAQTIELHWKKDNSWEIPKEG